MRRREKDCGAGSGGERARAEKEEEFNESEEERSDSDTLMVRSDKGTIQLMLRILIKNSLKIVALRASDISDTVLTQFNFCFLFRSIEQAANENPREE